MYRTCLTEIHGALQMTVEVYRVELRGQPYFSDSPHHAGRGSAGRGTCGGGRRGRRVTRGRGRALAGACGCLPRVLAGACHGCLQPLATACGDPFRAVPRPWVQNRASFPAKLASFWPQALPTQPRVLPEWPRSLPRGPVTFPRGIPPPRSREHICPPGRVSWMHANTL